MVDLEKKSKDSQEKIALYSSKNLFKYGVGELVIGYNIVLKEDAKFWLTNKAVRQATPEEVAKAYIRSK